MNQKRSILMIFVLTAFTSVVSSMFHLNNTQLIAVTLFAFKVYATLLLWKYRVGFAFMAIALLLAFGVLDIPHLMEFASFDVILFLVSMMAVVGFLEEKGFFEYLLNNIMGSVGKGSTKLIIILMVVAAIFASLVDEVTSILFMSAMILHLTGKYKVNPIPFILMIVFATNIGSSATVVGNPVGVMIAFKGGFGFSDFIRWATPISAASLALCIWISLRLFKGPINELGTSMSLDGGNLSDVSEGEGRGAFTNHLTSWGLFIGTITLLALHIPLEAALGLSKNTLLIGTAMGAAGIALLIDLEKSRDIIEKRVDWRTLIFFALLFASVGTLQYVGVTGLIADGIFSLSGGSDLGVLAVLTPVTAILTAFLDNVLAVAMFLPVVISLGEAGAYTFPLWWAMLFSGTLFGNATMIGSTANIVAIGMLEREKRGHITFLEWAKYGLAVAVPTLTLAILLLYLQIPMMPR